MISDGSKFGKGGCVSPQPALLAARLPPRRASSCRCLSRSRFGAILTCVVRRVIPCKRSVMKFGIGQAALRKEDHRLLTGAGCYLDDIKLPHQAFAYILRSPRSQASVPERHATRRASLRS